MAEMAKLDDPLYSRSGDVLGSHHTIPLLMLEGVAAAVPWGSASGALTGRLALSGFCARGELLLLLPLQEPACSLKDPVSALGQDGRRHTSTSCAATDVTSKDPPLRRDAVDASWDLGSIMWNVAFHMWKCNRRF